MSDNTSGFYKYEDGDLLHGPNFVYHKDFVLRREEIEDYKKVDFLPIDEWYWFDSREEAEAFFKKGA